MAYASLSRRITAALMISTVLVSCSAGDLVPPASIDNGTRVGAIEPMRNPTSREAMYQQPSPQAYQSGPAPMSQMSSAGSGVPRGDAYVGDSVHYLRAPGQIQSAPLSPASSRPQMQTSREGRLPMIDSDEAMRGGPRQASAAQYPSSRGGQLSIPDQGVNMDSEFGFGPDESDITGLAEDEDTDIAEGVGEQPVVDGIGTDNPVALPRRQHGGQAAGQPRYQPMANTDRVVVPPKRTSAGIQGDYANGGMTWGDGTRVTAPSRVPPSALSGAGSQQVAMIRPNNPAGSPMSDGPMSQPGQPWLREAMPQSEVICRAELRRLGVAFEDRPRIAPGGSCGIDYPVKLSGLSGNINVQPAVTLNCQTTLAFAKWVRNELAPAARTRYLVGVSKIVPMGGYSCRRMNNSSRRYNPMSEHARGNAIDIGQIVLKDGHEIDVRKKGFFSMREGSLLKTVRSDSCKYFNTVLGPGSNAEHWNHFHFDLRSRRSGGKYCSL